MGLWPGEALDLAQPLIYELLAGDFGTRSHRSRRIRSCTGPRPVAGTQMVLPCRPLCTPKVS